MTKCRIRVTRDTPISGAFEWARLDDDGAVLAAGHGQLDDSPVSGDCELVLASDLVLLDKVTASASQQRRLAPALRFLAEDLALPDPERLHVAAIPRAERDSLGLAIVDRQWLQSVLAKLGSAGLTARSAYPESLLPTPMPHAWTVVWVAGEGFVRTGRYEALALDCTEGDTPPVALRLALESAKGAGGGPQALVVHSTASSAAPDLKAWAAALGLPVESGPEWHWASARRPTDVELLQGEFAVRGAAGPWLRRLRVSAGLAAAVIALSSAAIALDWAAKVRERDTLLREMRTQYRESFGDNAVVVDAPLQMARALADLRQQAGQISAGDFVALLAVASERLLDPARHHVESISYEAGLLTLSLRPAGGQPEAALLEELRATAVPPGYEVRAEAAPGTGSIVLRLRAGRGA
jgi:general secretion pathway protein L